jgi:Tol biopolymer transport system component
VESTGYTWRTGDLWLVPVDTTASDPIAFQKTNFDESGGKISPDNTWVVYTSDESGQDEAYLKRLASPESDPWKLTSDGAFSPAWGPDGTEVFYVNNVNQLIRMKLRIGDSGTEVVERGPLFAVPPFTNEFDISPDGRTFVFTRSLELKKFDPMSLVVNWKALLE